jgi:hypothetical protein
MVTDPNGNEIRPGCRVRLTVEAEVTSVDPNPDAVANVTLAVRTGPRQQATQVLYVNAADVQHAGHDDEHRRGAVSDAARQGFESGRPASRAGKGPAPKAAADETKANQ